MCPLDWVPGSSGLFLLSCLCSCSAVDLTWIVSWKRRPGSNSLFCIRRYFKPRSDHDLSLPLYLPFPLSFSCPQTISTSSSSYLLRFLSSTSLPDVLSLLLFTLFAYSFVFCEIPHLLITFVIFDKSVLEDYFLEITAKTSEKSHDHEHFYTPVSKLNYQSLKMGKVRDVPPDQTVLLLKQSLTDTPWITGQHHPL